jgi:hypothetical protein
VDAAVVRLTQSARFSAIEALLSGGEAKARPATLPTTESKKKSDGVAVPAIIKPVAPAPAARVTASAPQPTRPMPPTRHVAPIRPAAASSGAASEADCARALSDPIVRRAMEVFEGSLVSVEREAAAPADVGDEE